MDIWSSKPNRRAFCRDSSARSLVSVKNLYLKMRRTSKTPAAERRAPPTSANGIPPVSGRTDTEDPSLEFPVESSTGSLAGSSAGLPVGSSAGSSIGSSLGSSAGSSMGAASKTVTEPALIGGGQISGTASLVQGCRTPQRNLHNLCLVSWSGSLCHLGERRTPSRLRRRILANWCHPHRVRRSDPSLPASPTRLRHPRTLRRSP